MLKTIFIHYNRHNLLSKGFIRRRRLIFIKFQELHRFSSSIVFISAKYPNDFHLSRSADIERVKMCLQIVLIYSPPIGSIICHLRNFCS